MRRTILLAGALPFVAAFLGSVLASAMFVPGMVEAQEARIRAAALMVTDSNGRDRILVGEGRAGIGTYVTDAEGTVRAQVALSQGGAPSLELRDGDGSTRIEVVAAGPVVGEGGTAIRVYSRDGTQVIRLGDVAPALGGGFGLSFRDQQERVRARIGVASDGSPSIRLLDAEGDVIWSVP